MHLLHWFYSNVWGNLVASMIWSIPLWTISYFKLKRQHVVHQQQLKDHIDYRFTKLTEGTTK